MSLQFEDRDRESVLRDLIDSDEEVRRLAVQRAIELPAEESIPRLVECLGDSSWRVRKAAVEQLVACGETGPVTEALIAALGDGENPGRRNSAVEALVGCGGVAVPKLVQTLMSDDVDVRKLAVDSLAGIGDARARAPMLEILSDSDANVRAAAVEALGALGGEGTTGVLLDIANRHDEESLVRFSALCSLARFELPVTGAQLVGALDDPTLQSAAFGVLGRVDDPRSVESLLKGMVAGSRAAREAAMAALLRLLGNCAAARAQALAESIRDAAAASPELVEQTADRLEDADLATQLVLIQFLGLIGTRASVLPVLAAARDEALTEVAHSTLESMGEVTGREIDARWSELDSEQRCDACGLLALVGDGTAVDRLVSALGEPDSATRAAAATALANVGCSDVLPKLVRCLETASQEDDFEAEEEVDAMIGALVRLAGPENDESLVGDAIALLSARLEGAVEPVRLAIARVLGRIGRVEDESLVVFLLKDPSPGVRRAAVDALSRLEPGAASEPLRLALADESPAVRMAAAAALGSSRNPHVLDDLGRLIHDEDDRVRAAAVRAMGTHSARSEGEPNWETIGPVLESVLMDTGVVAMAAVEALRSIGGTAAARLAVATIDRSEPELVQAAAACIGAHGDGEAVDELLPLVSHPAWAVRAEVIQLLADRRVAKAVPAILRRSETEQDDFVRNAILAALKRLEG